MRTRKRLGVDTDVWALVAADGCLLGGAVTLPVYWTKDMARKALTEALGCQVVRVRIVLEPETK